MKKYYIKWKILAALILPLYFMAPTPASPESNTDSKLALNIEIEGVRNSGGRVFLAIFAAEPENFPYEATSEKNTIYRKIYRVDSESISDRVMLPQGTYAIALFHDRNSNKELDRNMLGIPTEGHAFSNNPDTSRGKLAYKDLEFTLSQKTQYQVIKMVYLYDEE